jgi:hypothetical protein
LTLAIGTIEETVTVTGDAPLLEVTTTRIGANLTERQIQNLPTMSNMPVMLARFAPGNGFSANLVYTGSNFEELTTVEEYDREPWLWQTSNDARPRIG